MDVRHAEQLATATALLWHVEACPHATDPLRIHVCRQSSPHPT